MEGSRIINTIENWFPGIIYEEKGALAQYEALNVLANRFISYMESNSVEEKFQSKMIGQIIHLLYQSGDLYTRNAIENEFFLPISKQESPGALQRHISIFPSGCREGYLKVIMGSGINK